ncbi:MAG: enoyl-CoA hydratase-related protein [Acidobacteriota bacterium]
MTIGDGAANEERAAPLETRSWSSLRVEREHDLLWVTLDNPSKANALAPQMIEEITAVYSHDVRGDGVRAVLLQGAGRHFSAGADLEHLGEIRNAGPENNRRDSEALRGLFSAVLDQPALTIALVHGSCVAGGCGLATACDYVVAGESARFMYSEVRIGFVAALVATFLPLRVSGRDLRELLLDPDFVDATKALDIGLINRVVADDRLADAGRELAGSILRKASSESIARTKQLLLDVVGLRLGAALGHAAEVNAASRATDDCRHGVATFLETKKPPAWR